MVTSKIGRKYMFLINAGKENSSKYKININEGKYIYPY